MKSKKLSHCGGTYLPSTDLGEECFIIDKCSVTSCY